MIYIGADHAGYKLKEEIRKFLESKKIKYTDVGTYSAESVDYPEYALKVAKAVSKCREGSSDPSARGILVCGSGIGVCIVANKVRGVRAGLVWNTRLAKKSREDDDTNVLCLSGWETTKKEAVEIIDVWLKTKFSRAARHRRRVKKIEVIESSRAALS